MIICCIEDVLYNNHKGGVNIMVMSDRIVFIFCVMAVVAGYATLVLWKRRSNRIYHTNIASTGLGKLEFWAGIQNLHGYFSVRQLGESIDSIQAAVKWAGVTLEDIGTSADKLNQYYIKYAKGMLVEAERGLLTENIGDPVRACVKAAGATLEDIGTNDAMLDEIDRVYDILAARKNLNEIIKRARQGVLETLERLRGRNLVGEDVYGDATGLLDSLNSIKTE